MIVINFADDEDWEEQHEKLAEVLEQSGGGIGIVSAFPSSFHPRLSDYDDEAQLEMHEVCFLLMLQIIFFKFFYK